MGEPPPGQRRGHQVPPAGGQFGPVRPGHQGAGGFQLGVLPCLAGGVGGFQRRVDLPVGQAPAPSSESELDIMVED